MSDRDDLERARLSRDARRAGRTADALPGSPAFWGRVLTSGPQRGKFIRVQPVVATSATASPAEGATGTSTDQGAARLVEVWGDRVPAAGELVPVWGVPYRWVTEGAGGSPAGTLYALVTGQCGGQTLGHAVVRFQGPGGIDVTRDPAAGDSWSYPNAPAGEWTLTASHPNGQTTSVTVTHGSAYQLVGIVLPPPFATLDYSDKAGSLTALAAACGFRLKYAYTDPDGIATRSCSAFTLNLAYDVNSNPNVPQCFPDPYQPPVPISSRASQTTEVQIILVIVQRDADYLISVSRTICWSRLLLWLDAQCPCTNGALVAGVPTCVVSPHVVEGHAAVYADFGVASGQFTAPAGPTINLSGDLNQVSIQNALAGDVDACGDFVTNKTQSSFTLTGS